VRIVLLLFLLAVYLRQQLEPALERIDRLESSAAQGPSAYESNDHPLSQVSSSASRQKEERGAKSENGATVNSEPRISTIQSPNQGERQRRTNDPVKILYVGEFGLGHRLSKMSAAYHLVWMMRLEHNLTGSSGAEEGIDPMVLEASWGHCELENGTKVDISASLFGPEPLLNTHPSQKHGAIDHRHNEPLPPRRGKAVPKTIRIRNDVKGYYAGQMYKNARTVVTPELVQAWDYKMRTTDRELFHQLLRRFQFRDVATRYQRKRDWGGHFVVGVHFRLGNGEQEHFASSNRAVADATNLVRQTVRLILQYRKAVLSRSHDSSIDSSGRKPWAIFVASDTPDVLPMVQQALGAFQPGVDASDTIQLWASPSIPHLPEHGVSYTITESDACFDGWKFAMLDQYLLSHVHMLVAPTRSTFTQILPRAMVMSPRPPLQFSHSSRSNKVGSPGDAWKVGGTFCEVEFDQMVPSCSAQMSCYADSLDWLRLRNTTSRSLRVLIDDDSTLQCKERDSTHIERSLFVPHKVLVHVPETANESRTVWHAWQKLLQGTASASAGASGAVRYGGRIAKKYRSYAFHPDWTFG
jgi:hypothetical protein